ncbi:plasmid stabilization protein [Methylobacterium sp. NEAU 140]|uniref:FitA-like ribbon-helix-helix domain-containing protein n=1 Tax=Methylobacterium sp. NEAU 140 TaxID=3064945 RepID=UPI002734D7B1|nr:plasmid stabilization protein [Methylobacterium sp. NEAU 140]MDP4025813.1 plasmid stabilization protein [Methylobacterium sp. NEAU 140]
MPKSRTDTIVLRELDARVADRLRTRAASNRRSVEAEASAILTDALAPSAAAPQNLADAIRRRFAPLGGVDLEPHPPVTVSPAPRFGG